MVTSLWLHPVGQLWLQPCPCGNGLFPVEQTLDTQWLVLLLQSSGRDSSPIRKQRFFFFISYPEKAESPSPFFVASEAVQGSDLPARPLLILCLWCQAWLCAGLQLSMKRAVLIEIPPSLCCEERS